MCNNPNEIARDIESETSEKNIPLIIVDNYKDALLANLYSTVEMLKSEITEKNIIIDKLLTLIPSQKCTCRVVETSPTKSNRSEINTADKNSIISSQNLSNTPEGRNLNQKVYSWITSDDYSNYFDTSSKIIDVNKSEVRNDSSINSPLNDIPKHYYNDYLQAIGVESIDNKNHFSSNTNTSIHDYSVVNSKKHEWPDNTCLIVGDSILRNLNESRLSKRNAPVKVRCFSGCNIDDMYSYICPLLRKNPAHIVLHVGTNDAIDKSPDDILIDLLKLKSFILNKLPKCDVIISQPTARYDNSRAKVTIRNLNVKLNQLKINMVDNSNIDFEQLGKHGLHLNNWGTSRLAMNYISLMRQF